MHAFDSASQCGLILLHPGSQVTKVEPLKRSMHVILATSDYSFVSWLSQSKHAAG